MKPLELIRRPGGVQLLYDAWPRCFDVGGFLWIGASTRTKLMIAGIYPKLMTAAHHRDIAFELSFMKTWPRIELSVLRQMVRSLLLDGKFTVLKTLLLNGNGNYRMTCLMFAVCLELSVLPPHLTYKFINCLSNSLSFIMAYCSKHGFYGTQAYKWLMAHITGDRLLSAECYYTLSDFDLNVTGRFAKLNMQWYARAISMPAVWSRITSAEYQNITVNVTKFIKIPGFTQWCFTTHPSWIWFSMLNNGLFWKNNNWMLIYNLAVATLNDEFLQKSFAECASRYPFQITQLIKVDVAYEQPEWARRCDVEYLKNILLKLYGTYVVGV